jgi:hypothetical protein
MTQTLIEKLEALPRWWALVDGKSKLVLDAYAVGEIIEQAKAEKQEPIARVLTLSNLGFSTRGSIEWIGNKYSLRPNDLLYTAPQPDIVAELVKALEEAFELTRYDFAMEEVNKRWAALLAKAKEMMG